jgi:hypothetical protein
MNRQPPSENQERTENVTPHRRNDHQRRRAVHHPGGRPGPHRKIGLVRILRTPLVVAAIIPLFLTRPVTHGNGLLVELAGLAAGLPYAIVWTLIVAGCRGRPLAARATA